MRRDFKTHAIGLGRSYDPADPETRNLIDYLNLKLDSRGFQIVGNREDFPFLEIAHGLVANFRQKLTLLADHLCPVDQRIHDWLASYLASVPEDILPADSALLPSQPFILEQHGLSRLLSLPATGNSFRSDIITSFRTDKGVCHNPANDRRTTKGVFHVAEGGLPIPADKKAVPVQTFAALLQKSLRPPDDLMTLPFTGDAEEPARAFLSILLRPLASPEVPGLSPAKYSEIRFFAPGNLASNLDFVESIFGNAGDPNLPENDSARDPEHWTGHTGCVILAPHLTTFTKKELGLPRRQEASPRQIRDGMCWESEDELYNDGSAFKITARDERGTMVTIIADNYFGYCKKEVKTQISFSCNLSRTSQEEHAGGCLAFPSFDHGESFALQTMDEHASRATFSSSMKILGDAVEIHPEGYATDREFSDIIYLPENAEIEINGQRICWQDHHGKSQKTRLQPGTTYVYPSGYKVEMVQPSDDQRWRLRGIQAEGTFLHKPCTVSGGGKSEISKPFEDAMVDGPIIIPDFKATLEKVRQLVEKNYFDRWIEPRISASESRAFLDHRRSLGSAVRLLTTSDQYKPEYNSWLENLSAEAVELAMVIKRYYKQDWGSPDDWDVWSHRFSVDLINNEPGRELKYRNHKLRKSYVRVGYLADGSWRLFSLRKDFLPAVKLQREDDITASTVLDVNGQPGMHPALPSDRAYRFAENCEYRLFQRPDEAIHRGYDKTTEGDFIRPGNFFSNYQPLTCEEVAAERNNALTFGQYTPGVQDLIHRFLDDPEKAQDPSRSLVLSSHPRVTGPEGQVTKNPRYLQDRPDLHNPRGEHLAGIGMRLYRGLEPSVAPLTPVNAVLPGRRLNPPDRDAGVRNLAVFGPIHYQELPELFMDLIACLTGKSPSTTGAGSEGALTKAPFNALLPIHDLNDELRSLLRTRQPVFSGAAGHVGPKLRVDHDISLLIPEVWSRMHIYEREPEWLIENEMLEKCEDFQHGGSTILASRLGYRINEKFVDRFFGRVFADPGSVFTTEMLRPEIQDLEAYADGIRNICEAMQRIAGNYFEDGSIDHACPALKALLHIMKDGNHEGRDVHDPAIRALFALEALDDQ